MPVSFASILPAALLGLVGVSEPFVDRSGDLPLLRLPSVLVIYGLPGSTLLTLCWLRRPR